VIAISVMRYENQHVTHGDATLQADSGDAAGAKPRKRMPVKLRILQLEDLESDAFLIQAILRTHFDAEYRRVERRDDFLKQLQEFRPHLIIADYTLPQLTGLEALRLVKIHDRTLPFVLVTGTQTEDVAVECMKEGADDYILKSSLMRLPGALRNIFKRRRARREKRKTRLKLRHRARQYRLLFKFNPHPMFLYDTQTLGYLAVNDAAIEHYGYSRAEFMTMTPKDIRPKEDVADFLAEYRQFQAEGKLKKVGIRRHKKKNGDVILVEITANPIRFKRRDAILIMANDVTYRIKAEERLRASEELNRRILETVPGGIVLVGRDGAIQTANAEAQRILGLGFDALTSRYIATFASETIREDGTPCSVEDYPVSKCLAAGRQQQALTIGCKRPDGMISWAIFSAAPVFESGTDILSAAVVTFIDITARKMAEQALRDSEERYRVFMEQSSEAIWRIELREPIDLDQPPEKILERVYAHGWLGECNDAMARMYGFTSHHELTGAPLTQLMVRTDPKNTEFLLAFIRSGGRLVDAESHELDRFGNEKYFLNNLVAIFKDEKIIRVWGTQRDITERKRAESALRESEERFRQMADNIRQVFYVSLPDYSRVLYVSPAFEEIFGRTCASLYQDPGVWLATVHEGDRDRLQAASSASAGTGEYSAEYRVVRPDGSIRWVCNRNFEIKNEQGVIYRHVGSVEDITERRKAEQELARSLSLITATLESIADGILVSDEDHIISFNQKFVEMWRIPKEILSDTRRCRQYCMDQTNSPESALKRVLEIFKDTEEERIDILELKDGRVLERYSKPHLIESHSKTRVWSFRDITERIRAEQNRLAIERKLLETQKLESLGVLAGGIAHDFNNLLAAVLGNASLMGMQMPLDSPLRPYLSSIETATHRAAELCKQMLAYSGKGRFVIQSLNLNTLIQEMAELLRISIRKRVTLQFNLLPELPHLFADATQLRQVIMNLIINAAEAIATDSAGEVTLTTGVTNVGSEELKEVYSAPELSEGEYLYLEVIDNGCGMDAETKSRIFDPFFTTKFTGRGLGLAAVLGIIRSHKGAIALQSAPEQGTTFKILLPPGGRQ